METPQLQVSDLYQRRQSKDTARLKAYNQILESIYHRIRAQSKLPNSPCSLLYTIPPFGLGLPKIDLEDCVVYLVFQLRHSGFEVRYSYPNLLAISWMHHERSYITEQSPIMQAMLAAQAAAAPVPAPRKRAPKAIMANSQSVPNQAGPSQRTGMAGPSQRKQKGVAFSVGNDKGPSVGALPSAEAYVPPSTFLQTMTKPDPKSAAMSSGVLADLWGGTS
jgi:hypothetical protein